MNAVPEQPPNKSFETRFIPKLRFTVYISAPSRFQNFMREGSHLERKRLV